MQIWPAGRFGGPSRRGLLFELPSQLKLDFFLSIATFVLDVDDGIGWNRHSLARHLNPKPLTAFEGVSKAAQLLDKVLRRLLLLNITTPSSLACRHRVLSVFYERFLERAIELGCDLTVFSS